MADEQQFPSEDIDLPSKGVLYPKDSPLASGKLEVKYMTAREEDILTSQNLIKNGTVIDKLIDSLILTKGVDVDDLVLGDKNAIMVAARILAYGSEYPCEVMHPLTGETFVHSFNLTDCKYKTISDKIKGNEFDVKLPNSKLNITYKILTGVEEKAIAKDIAQVEKLGSDIIPELTTRLRYTITAVGGDSSTSLINTTVQNMLARDSLFLRGEITKNSPDIDMSQEIEIEGETVTVDIPMTANFFWPSRIP